MTAFLNSFVVNPACATARIQPYAHPRFAHPLTSGPWM
jgi:hypothetical protein